MAFPYRPVSRLWFVHICVVKGVHAGNVRYPPEFHEHTVSLSIQSLLDQLWATSLGRAGRPWESKKKIPRVNVVKDLINTCVVLCWIY